MKPIVGVIMGSKSDYEIMSSALEALDLFNINYEVEIVSAHRTPEKLFEYAKSSEERGLKVIIAGAGGAAHLPGMVASLTNLPVIGVPVFTKTLNGVDSMLSILQMPKGIVVATVAINNSFNAGLLASSILALSDNDIKKKLDEFKKNQTNEVLNTKL